MSKPWDKLRGKAPIGGGVVDLSGYASVGLSEIDSKHVLVAIGASHYNLNQTKEQYFNKKACLQMAELFTELASQLEN